LYHLPAGVADFAELTFSAKNIFAKIKHKKVCNAEQRFNVQECDACEVDLYFLPGSQKKPPRKIRGG
jgi:hypothetical protein